MNKVLLNAFRKAKSQGRLCVRCGWIVTVPRYKQGKRLCWACEDALKGVNTLPRWGKWLDEPRDKTGEMT